jgi:predicted AlkP superfamily pyrophosphatase or phosphodiesterase
VATDDNLGAKISPQNSSHRMKHTPQFVRQIILAAVAVLAVALPGNAQTKPITDLQPTVILISLDAFRYDYLAKYPSPNLNYLARTGVRARWLIPSFPTKTFPNHYTIATGLYPAHHGIVENEFYDPQFDAVFNLHKREEVEKGRWWLGEPIWVTAEKQNQRTAALFFPGTEAEIAGRRPSYWKVYDDKLSNDDRIDTILQWLDLPQGQRPTLLTAYFSEADDVGHHFGPDSKQTRQAVFELDQAIGRLIDGLRSRQILAQVNLIIVSDHGMATSDPKNMILLDQMFDTSLAERIFWTPEIVSIFPRPGYEQQIYSSLRQHLPPQARVFRKSELPERFHYRDSARIAPLLVLPDEGWALMNREGLIAVNQSESGPSKGRHGYDNKLRSMRATFIGHGQAFKSHTVVAPFSNIQIYNIMARILGLKAAPNDGDSTAARQVLKRSKQREKP